MAAVELLSQLAYLACVVVAVRLWASNRTRQAAWSAATFTLLGTLVVVGFFLEDDQVLPDPWGKLFIVLVLLLPWFLWRFADSVVAAPRALRLVVDVVAVGTALSALVIELPDPTATPTSAQEAYILVIVGVWFAQAILTTGLLWRASMGQPGVTRGRLRMLGLGAILLGFAVVAGSGPGTEETNQAISQVFSLAAAVTFLVGYAPPRSLRQAWRGPDEAALYHAAVGLLEAQEAQEVEHVLLPGLARLLGAAEVTVVDDEAAASAAGEGEMRIQLGPWTLGFAQAPSMPLFGAGEEELVSRLGLMANLATERVRLHASERVAREEAEAASAGLARANRDLESVNDELEAFVYSTSHDLKNPIIAILGYVEVLQKDFSEQLPEDAAWYIERMSVNARFIDSLIRDLLELSRVGRMETTRSHVDLNELLTGITVDAVQRHPELELTVNWPDDLPALEANPTRARQLLENMVENAARYAGRPDVRVDIACVQDTAGITLHIRDNGQGIPAEQCERIFGMFERLDPDKATGTGIGLAICRRIVEQLGGQIDALPSGDGAHFRISLPAEALSGDGHGHTDSGIIDPDAPMKATA